MVLRAAVFFLSAKYLMGASKRPPPARRWLGYWKSYLDGEVGVIPPPPHSQWQINYVTNSMVILEEINEFHRYLADGGRNASYTLT